MVLCDARGMSASIFWIVRLVFPLCIGASFLMSILSGPHLPANFALTKLIADSDVIVFLLSHELDARWLVGNYDEVVLHGRYYYGEII